MIYRIVVGRQSADARLVGAGFYLGDVMRELNLPVPDLWARKPWRSGCPRLQRQRRWKVKFYFTEEGWRRFGPRIVAAARERGLTVKVIREKNPPRSRVVYRDRWQVAVLPRREKK